MLVLPNLSTCLPPPEHEPQAKQGQDAQPKAADIILQALQVGASRQQPHTLRTGAKA